MLSLMHEAEPYGELRDAGQPLGVSDLVQLLGGTAAEVKRLLRELEGRSVFSRCDDGAIYSRRMKRDFLKAHADKENGGRGGNPNLKPNNNPPDNPKGGKGVNPQDNGQDKARGRTGAPDHFHIHSLSNSQGKEEAARDGQCDAHSVVVNLAKSLRTKPPPFTPGRDYQLSALRVVGERRAPAEPIRTPAEQLAILRGEG